MEKDEEKKDAGRWRTGSANGVNGQLNFAMPWRFDFYSTKLAMHDALEIEAPCAVDREKTLACS